MNSKINDLFDEKAFVTIGNMQNRAGDTLRHIAHCRNLQSAASNFGYRNNIIFCVLTKFPWDFVPAFNR